MPPTDRAMLKLACLPLKELAEELDISYSNVRNWSSGHKEIPEKTPEKVSIQKRFKEARKQGADMPGLSQWNARWVGEEGYKGIVARQLQEFKKRQKEKAGG